MKERGAALLLLCVALVSEASFVEDARADEPAKEAPSSTIAVLCAPGDRFGLRLVAELESLGFRAVILDPAAEPTSRASLETAARSAGAIAAIHAVSSEHGVEMWIADRVTGKTVLREVASTDDAPDRDAALALRAVELLRASLLEVALPAPPPGEVPATPEIREKMQLPASDALAAQPAPALRFALAPGVLLSPGHLGPAGSLTLDLAWIPSDHVGLVGLAAIPLTRPQVAGAAGSADLAVLLAAGGARFLFTTRESRWAPSADLGAMVVSLWSKGTANPGFTAGTSSAVTAALFARLGVAFAPIPSLRLRADVLAGVVPQGVSIQVAGQEIATWGRPLVLPSAGIDFGWF